MPYTLANEYIPMNARAIRYIICCLLLCLSQMVQAQRDTQHATTFGMGRANYLDTYLSPQNYKGPQLTIMNETLRRLLRNNSVTFQTLTTAHVALADNASARASDIGGGFTYDAGWHYTKDDVLLRGLQLMIGGQAGGSLGFLYNNRNGNNPAQGYLSAHLSLSGAAIYAFRIKHQRLKLRYQASMPLVGAMFSPNYGQSYYEIFSRGDYDHNVCMTYPGNALSFTQLLSADIPVRHSTLRVGYLCSLQQAKVNHLKQHHYARSFMIGYVRELSIKR